MNHSAHEPSGLELAGRTPDGRPVYLNREWLQADRRIVLGFIEPHFMAGFSGGYKGVFPALADIDAIMHYHRADVIGDPRSTWGRLEDNPTQDQIRANGSLAPVDFCVNVTLNRRREITGFYCGDALEAHREGCRAAKATAMVACDRAYPVVVTTNSGYPLDQNLYQAVKGMSAAAQIVEPGRRDPRRGALQRRLPVARQLPDADDRPHGSRRPCSTRSWRPASRCTTSGRRSCWRSSC